MLTRKRNALKPKNSKALNVPASRDPDMEFRDKELQKEISKCIRKWLSPSKHRTIPLLAKKTHLAESSLREYLKGETHVSPHRAMAIVAVCNPEEWIDFVEKFLPEIYPPIQKSIDARANKKLADSGVLQRITDLLADADMIKSPAFQQLAGAIKFLFHNGMVVGKGKRIAMMGGVSGGIVIKIHSSTFETVVSAMQHSKSIRIEQDFYRLRSFNEIHNIMTLEKTEGHGQIFLCSEQCKLFDEIRTTSLGNHLKPNVDAIQ